LHPLLGVQIAGQLGAEAVQLIAAAEVLLATEDGVVAYGAQHVGPSDRIGGQWRGVVPASDAVDEAARHERHARG